MASLQFWVGLIVGCGAFKVFQSLGSEKKQGLKKSGSKEKASFVVLGAVLVGVTLWNVITSTLAVLGSMSQEAFALPYAMEKLVMVPLEPYNTCSDRVLHLSCLTTIIADLALTTSIPMSPTLHPQLCDDIVLAQAPETPNPEAATIVQEAHVRLCYQVNGIVGALVEAETKKHKSKLKQRITRYLDSTNAESVALAVSSSSGHGYVQHRIVDRKVIAMRQHYKPYSKKNNKDREVESNRGNFIWHTGATRIFNPFTNLFVKYNSDEARTASAFVSAMANALDLDDAESSKSTFRVLTAAIRRIDAPTLQLGIGIQKDFDYASDMSEFKLFEFQKRYFREMEKRQTNPAIAVQGELTRLACENSGIKNCVTMGCPSLTINTEENLGMSMEENWKKLMTKLMAKEKIKLGLVLPKKLNKPSKTQWRRHEVLIQIFKQLAQVHDVTVILQSKSDRTRVKDSGLHEFVQKVIFSNTEDWFNFTANLDLILSARIHGGMAGVVSATPTVVLPTDLRIQELVETMLVPNLPLQTIQKQFDIALTAKESPQDFLVTLLRLLKLDFQAFERNRRQLIVQWNGILRQANLEMNPKLLQVIQGGV